MYIIGLYCNLIFEVLVSKEAAFDINSMFIIHSPFEEINYLKYPLISIIALFIYFIIFKINDFIKYKKSPKS